MTEKKTADKDLLYHTTITSHDKKLVLLKANQAISPENKDLFLRFLTNLEAQGTTTSQRLSYLSYTTPILEALGSKPIKEATKTDMETIFAGYRSRYKQGSMNKIGQCAKTLWRYAYDLASQDPAPPAVRWLKTIKTRNNMRPEDLWTEADINKFIGYCRRERDKVIFSVLFEAGFRPGELRGLKIGDVVFNGDVVRLYVRGKTEKKQGERVVPLIRCYNILREWVAAHPRKNDKNAWLWSYTDKPMDHANLATQLQRISKEAGITKPTNPYVLRHSALTRAYKTLPGTLARSLGGHVSGAMEATYVHLAESDIDAAVRKMNGLPTKEAEVAPVCLRCGKTLEPGIDMCRFCGVANNQAAALSMNERLLRMESAIEKLMNIALRGDIKDFSDKAREKDKGKI